MIHRSTILPAASALALIQALHASPAQAQSTTPGCQLTKEAQLPLVERSRRFLVEAEINGEKRLFVVDSGAEKSALAPDVADALNLPSDYTSAQKVNGVGAPISSQYPRVVNSIKLGTAQWTNLKLPTTGPTAFASFAQPNLAGMLGADVLSRFDVELNFPAHTMTLYTAQNCLGRFAPWHGDYQALSPAYTQRHRFLIDMALDGYPAHAVLDTGAGASLVGSDAALRAGVDDAALLRDPALSGQGVSGTSIKTHLHRFNTVQVGTRVFRNANMLIGDTSFSPGTDMLLGMDFMKHRRVWLSYSTGWVFMQLEGLPANASQAASAPVSPAAETQLDAAGQLQTVYASGVAWANLPAGPLPQFSSHSHMTYRMIPHIVQTSRLSPQALPQGSLPAQ